MQCVRNAKMQIFTKKIQHYSSFTSTRTLHEWAGTWNENLDNWVVNSLFPSSTPTASALPPYKPTYNAPPALQRAHAYRFQMSCISPTFSFVFFQYFFHISPTFSFVFLCFTFSYFNLGWFVTQFCWAWHVDGDHLVTKAEMGLSWLPPWSNSSTGCCTFSVCTTCIDLHPHVSWSHWPYLRFCLCASEASPHFASSDKPRDARRWEKMGLNIHILWGKKTIQKFGDENNDQ